MSSSASESDREKSNIDEDMEVFATVLNEEKEELLAKLQLLNTNNVCILNK